MGPEAGGTTGAGVLSLSSHSDPTRGCAAWGQGREVGREGTRGPGGGQLVAEGLRRDKLGDRQGEGGRDPVERLLRVGGGRPGAKGETG